MKSAIIFDWNGTLLDDANAVLQTINAILSRFGRAAVDMHKLREKFELPPSVLFRNLDMSKDEIESYRATTTPFFTTLMSSWRATRPYVKGSKCFARR
ncbi:phosphoglycolate phosphatase-like HAD superfamily hydrolase [Bradyrhizobium sp. USDA 4011]